MVEMTTTSLFHALSAVSESLVRSMYSEFIRSSDYNTKASKNNQPFKISIYSCFRLFIRSDGAFCIKVEHPIADKENRTEHIEFMFKPTPKGQEQMLDCVFYIIAQLDNK